LSRQVFLRRSGSSVAVVLGLLLVPLLLISRNVSPLVAAEPSVLAGTSTACCNVYLPIVAVQSDQGEAYPVPPPHLRHDVSIHFHQYTCACSGAGTGAADQYSKPGAPRWYGWCGQCRNGTGKLCLCRRGTAAGGIGCLRPGHGDGHDSRSDVRAVSGRESLRGRK